MVLFIVALSLAGLSLIIFFLAVPPHFAGNRTARRLSIIGSTVGVISGIGFIGIAAVPADVNLTLHRLLVYIAFTGFLLVVFCYSAAILKSRTYPRAYAYAYLAYAVVLAVYLVLLFSGPEVETTRGLTIQAVGQKIVVYTGIICVVIQSYGSVPGGTAAAVSPVGWIKSASGERIHRGLRTAIRNRWWIRFA